MVLFFFAFVFIFFLSSPEGWSQKILLFFAKKLSKLSIYIYAPAFYGGANDKVDVDDDGP